MWRYSSGNIHVHVCRKKKLEKLDWNNFINIITFVNLHKSYYSLFQFPRIEYYGNGYFFGVYTIRIFLHILKFLHITRYKCQLKCNEWLFCSIECQHRNRYILVCSNFTFKSISSQATLFLFTKKNKNNSIFIFLMVAVYTFPMLHVIQIVAQYMGKIMLYE